MHDLSQVSGSIKCMEACKSNWLGMKFKFPLIWFPKRKYMSVYKLSKKTERDCSANLVVRNGFYMQMKNPNHPST